MLAISTETFGATAHKRSSRVDRSATNFGFRLATDGIRGDDRPSFFYGNANAIRKRTAVHDDRDQIENEATQRK